MFIKRKRLKTFFKELENNKKMGVQFGAISRKSSRARSASIINLREY